MSNTTPQYYHTVSPRVVLWGGKTVTVSKKTYITLLVDKSKGTSKTIVHKIDIEGLVGFPKLNPMIWVNVLQKDSHYIQLFVHLL